jgi:hypothetical protein
MKRNVMMVLLVAGACATAPSPRSSVREQARRSVMLPPAAPPPELRAAYAEGNETLMGATIEDLPAAHAKALGIYNRVLAIKPDFMDALNDKAWILATTPDPTLRQARESLAIAQRAADSLARTGMLRTNREAFAEDHTTGRMLVVATTYAAALAANGIFFPGDTRPGVADCPATAMTVIDFVVQAAMNLDERFHTPSTAEMVRRAREYQASFSQRKPLVGVPPLASLLSPATRLR